jgi:hypothetical protein
MYKRKQFRNRIICTKENGKMATKYDSGKRKHGRHYQDEYPIMIN